MIRPPATRTHLRTKRAQLELALRGREVLEEKRAALVRELLPLADQVLSGRASLEAAARDAHRALARAEAVAGPEAVRSAALATRREIPLAVTTVHVMGVSVPRIEIRTADRARAGRNYSIVGSSTTLDDAAAAFDSEIRRILDLAQSELRLLRLAREIQATSRRVHALEHILVPRLIAERDWIEVTLDERERADRFRLKRLKNSLVRRRASAAI